MITRRTHAKKAMAYHIAYIIFLTIAGAACAYSAIYTLLHITCSDDIIAVSVTATCAALVFAVDFFEFRAISAKHYMTDEGIGVMRFNKTKVFIKWSDIKEAGEGVILTPFGSKKRAYFCDRKLSESEKSDLITLKRHTVHFSYIPKSWFKIISGRISVPVPEEIIEKYVK